MLDNLYQSLIDSEPHKMTYTTRTLKNMLTALSSESDARNRVITELTARTLHDHPHNNANTAR